MMINTLSKMDIDAIEGILQGYDTFLVEVTGKLPASVNLATNIGFNSFIDLKYKNKHIEFSILWALHLHNMNYIIHLG